MPEHVADAFQGLAIAEQMDGQRVAQGVGPAARRLDGRLVKAAGHPAVDRATERAVRWPARQEDDPAVTHESPISGIAILE